MYHGDIYEHILEGPHHQPPGPLAAPAALWWRALDGRSLRGYAPAFPGAGWHLLQPLQRVQGPSHAEQAGYHYVVETDVPPAREEEFNAWYREEHLPGLAAVPGTVGAYRFLRQAGRGPRYVACYDLLSPQVTQSAEWLAVRHTPWSSRVRPWFFNTRRTFHIRLDTNSP